MQNGVIHRFAGKDVPYPSTTPKQYDGRIVSVSNYTEAFADVYYGSQKKTSLTITLDNTDGFFSKLLWQDVRNLPVQVDWVDLDGETTLHTLSLLIDGVKVEKETATVTCVDDDLEIWKTVLPKYRITEDIFGTGTIPDEAKGKPIAVWFGLAENVPLYPIQEDTTNNYYDYLIGHGTINEVITVYREGNGTKVVANSEVVSSGETDEIADFKLINNFATFVSDGVQKNMMVRNGNTNQMTFIENVDSQIQLTLRDDIFNETQSSAGGEYYEIGGEYQFYDGTQTSEFTGYAFIRFRLEQRDRNGNPYTLTAAVNGVELDNVASALVFTDRNPAGVLLNIMTNSTWGMGLNIDPQEWIDAIDSVAGSAFDCAGGLHEFKKASEWRDILLLQCKLATLKRSTGGYELVVPAYHTAQDDTVDQADCSMKLSRRKTSDYVKEIVVHFKIDNSDNSYLLEERLSTDKTFGATKDYYCPFLGISGGALIARMLYNRFIWQDRMLETEGAGQMADWAVFDRIIIDNPYLELYGENFEVLEITRGYKKHKAKLGEYTERIFG
jgi:hypothetical protein